MNTTTATDWNPRFVHYARVHGRTPEAMLTFDGERYPGGKMGGFLTWNSQHLRSWQGQTGRKKPDGWSYYPMSPADHTAYDQWLAQLPAQTA